MLRFFFRPIDSAVLTYFRFFAGVLLAWELVNGLLLGDLAEYTSPFHFTYLYFDWVKPWPKLGMIAHYLITVIAGLYVAVGYKQRASACVLFAGYTTLFLMEKSEYVNHFYLYCLISFWMIFLPVNKDRVRAWIYYVLLFHISLVYIFAGIAKLDPDWLSGRSVEMMVPSIFLNIPFSRELITYGGLGFDLLIVPALMFKQTRKAAFIVCCGFHLTNVVMFGLATFPWFCIMMTALFFGTSWPRRFSWFDHFFTDFKRSPNPETPWQGAVFSSLAVYFFIQLAVPLRHHLYPGFTTWTEDGHQFSWRMKLREKSGDVIYYVYQKDDFAPVVVKPEKWLTPKQYDFMIGRPDEILEFAHYLKNEFNARSVHASSRVSLNGRQKFEMIHTEVDLTKEERKLGAYSWVNPLPDFEKPGQITSHDQDKWGLAHNQSAALQ